jgi:hypothetical protein
MTDELIIHLGMCVKLKHLYNKRLLGHISQSSGTCRVLNMDSSFPDTMEACFAAFDKDE